MARLRRGKEGRSCTLGESTTDSCGSGICLFAFPFAFWIRNWVRRKENKCERNKIEAARALAEGEHKGAGEEERCARRVLVNAKGRGTGEARSHCWSASRASYRGLSGSGAN